MVWIQFAVLHAAYEGSQTLDRMSIDTHVRYLVIKGSLLCTNSPVLKGHSTCTETVKAASATSRGEQCKIVTGHSQHIGTNPSVGIR